MEERKNLMTKEEREEKEEYERKKKIKEDLYKNFGEGPYEIMIAGTFDILHPGHIHYIQEASQYGKVTVILSRDVTVKKIK